MDSKIQGVLDRLAKQEKFELENHDKVPHSERMLAITPRIGQFYNILLRSINAKCVLEIGTSVGYSTIWFADALRNNSIDSKIISIEIDQNKIQRAQKNFQDAEVSEFIEIIQGDALEVLKKIKNEVKTPFDFIFIDADKERYIQYFDSCLPMMRIGGLIGADNILQPERFRAMMNEYVDYVRKNTNVLSETIPIDNGEELTLRIK